MSSCSRAFWRQARRDEQPLGAPPLDQDVSRVNDARVTFRTLALNAAEDEPGDLPPDTAQTDHQDLGLGYGSTGPVPHRPFDRAGRRGQRDRCAEERGGEGQRRADGMRHGVSWCRDVQPRSAATVTGDAPPLLGCTAS